MIVPFRRRRGAMVVVLVLASSLFRCALLSTTRSTEAQLAQVTKEWCMTIRASQVLCTYPLTEDLQVGDMYVVSTSIEDQIRQYEDRGFLPFDLLLWRLQPKGYDEMYGGFYNTRGYADVIPHQWQFPATAAAGATAWTSAPVAAFPTYAFSIERGQGFNLAVPVESVPVGLSLLNTGTATGSIAIDDASTYGVPVGILEQQVDEWARIPANRAMLARYAPATDAATGKEIQYFLRVVARVYVTGSVNVSLQSGEQRGAGVDAGAAPPVSVIGPQDLQSVVNAVQPSQPGAAAPSQPAPAPPSAPSNPAPPASLPGTTIAKAAAGGAIRIAALSSGSVSMSETFGRPLVIGYTAFDRPIGRGGILGNSIPTLQRIERQQKNRRP